MLEAPAPWGPWSLFYRSDDAPLAPGLYTPTFPSAYLEEPRADGTARLVMFFSCLEGAPTCRYTLNYVTVTLGLTPTAFAGLPYGECAARNSRN